MRLAVSKDAPKEWPAWNMDYEDQMREPRAYVHGPATIAQVMNELQHMHPFFICLLI